LFFVAGLRCRKWAKPYPSGSLRHTIGGQHARRRAQRKAGHNANKNSTAYAHQKLAERYGVGRMLHVVATEQTCCVTCARLPHLPSMFYSPITERPERRSTRMLLHQSTRRSKCCSPYLRSVTTTARASVHSCPPSRSHGIPACAYGHHVVQPSSPKKR